MKDIKFFVIVILLTISLCLNAFLLYLLKNKIIENSDNVISEVETNEAVQETTEEYDFSSAMQIGLMYDFDTSNKSWGGSSFFLRLQDNKANFRGTIISNNKYDEINSDFSVETFENLLEMLCQNDLEEITYTYDNNGKIVETNLDHVLGLYINGSVGTVYIKDPENIDDILAEFERLANASGGSIIADSSPAAEMNDYEVTSNDEITSISDETTGVYATASTGGLRARVSPDTDSEIIFQLEADAQVEVLDKSDTWTRIKFNGMEGYVLTEYLTF